MAVSDADISHALLISTRDGTYPESEDVLTTDLSASRLQPSLQLISEAKHRIETDIRALSQNSSSDIDEWITHARQLQEDIKQSTAVAREIVIEYEEGQNLSAGVEDAEAKLNLLQNETSFNDTVTSSLEDIWSLDKDLTEAEAILATGNIIELVATIKQLSLRTERLTSSNAKEINTGRISQIQDAVAEGLTAAASSMLEFQKFDVGQRLAVNHGNHESLGVPLDHLCQALEKLGSQDGLLRILSRTFQRRICQAVLSRSSEAVTCSIDEVSHSLTLSPKHKRKDAENVLDCISQIFVFIHTHLPLKLSSAVGTILSEELVGILIRDWLTPSVPLSLSELRSSNIKVAIGELADLMSSYRLPSHDVLRDWAEGLPRIWLEKRRTSALDAVRRALKARRGPNKEVVRVERQNIVNQDDSIALNDIDDSTASCGEDELEAVATLTNRANEEEDEEDLSGWDFDEDAENNGGAVPSPNKANGNAEDKSDASRWGKTNADETGLESRTERPNAVPSNSSTEHREVTLTETYTVTDIPDYLLEIVSSEVRDAEQMKISEDSALKRINASASLLSLPTLILAMFRATAPAYYTSAIPNGNMHLYNDCMYVVEKLTTLARDLSLTQLLDDCNLLEKFARDAYAKDMDLQRTILSDILDGAQGFVNCTRSPYSAECKNAVSATVDRLRAVHHDWSSILSRSALLQSIGSLLSSVIEKIVKDVEDLEDISEAESQRLTTFCGQFSALEELFIAERLGQVEEADVEPVPLTAVYVPNWLRFQYLSNILESSLVDIKYLWTEGELSLEFTADEVTELIEALFAESSHRRNAIAEIRRSRS